MATNEPVQNYSNHAMNVPLYHYFALPVLFANLAFTVIDAVRAFDTRTAFGVLVAAALIVLAFYARVFALRAQDRVIRLEMRLRLRELLPADLQPRIGQFTIDQLVALRFASDAELAELAAAVLRDDVRDRKTIKKMVRDWQPDHARV